VTSLEKVLSTHKRVVEEGYTENKAPRYRSYAVTTLRGGVGKSTLSSTWPMNWRAVIRC
jgi:chromosome partitioning protein